MEKLPVLTGAQEHVMKQAMWADAAPAFANFANPMDGPQTAVQGL